MRGYLSGEVRGEGPKSEGAIVRATGNGLRVTAYCIDRGRVTTQGLDQPATVREVWGGRERGRWEGREGGI